MNYLRTVILLAGLTGLFMAVGYLIGGAGGAVIALVIAAATNLFSYWNADRLVLSMHNAQEVDERSAPEFVAIIHELAQHAGLPMPRVHVNGPAHSLMRSPPDETRNTRQSVRRPVFSTRSAGKRLPGSSATNLHTCAITTH